MGKVIRMVTEDKEFDIGVTLGEHGKAIEGLDTRIGGLDTKICGLKADNDSQHLSTSNKVDRIQWGIVLLLISVCGVFLQQILK